MKKFIRPLSLLLFVTFPQLLAIGYMAVVAGTMGIAPITLAIVLLLAAVNGFFTWMAVKKRNEAAFNLKIYGLITGVFILSSLLAALFGREFILGGGPLSPRIVYAEASGIAVIYGLAGIAWHTASPDKANQMVKYVLGIISVPVLWLLATNLVSGANSNTILTILFVAGIYAALFLLVKVLFSWRMNRNSGLIGPLPARKTLLPTLIIALCLPLAGLAVNQIYAVFLGGSMNSAGLFGDFSHPLYYIIAAVNGALLLIPAVKDEKLRLVLFYLKATGFTYIIYFFIVFLPLLPLGIIGLLYLLGVFILVPTAVLILQGRHLIKEGMALAKSWGVWRPILVFFIGLITLPLCLSASLWGDKGNFKAASGYLEKESYKNAQEVDLHRLERTLGHMKAGLRFERGGFLLYSGGFGFSNGTAPILSDLYSRAILDGKTISQENIRTLENLFYDAGHALLEERLSDPGIVSSSVRLQSVEAQTRYDEKSGVYKSWVRLKLENLSSEGNGEYMTVFKLPDGAYISDYSLNVLGTEKAGILADRRAALMIYTKIVNTRRDPGLLRYIGKNTLELRVFPFNGNETRETGFEIIHSQKMTLNVDGRLITLDGDEAQKEVRLDGATLLPAEKKTGLRSVKREPKYYFVVDASKNSDVPWLLGQIQEYAQVNHIADGEVLFTSYKVDRHSLADMMQAGYRTESGFNLNMAVQMILEETPETFPVIIAVSDNMPGAVYPRDAFHLSQKYPKSPYYYSLNHNLTLTPYSYEDNKKGETVDRPVMETVLDYNGMLVLDNQANEVILTESQKEGVVLGNNQYENAILLNTALQRSLYEGKVPSLEMVRGSFKARILTPQTAFIVVETKEQEKELLELQEQLLSANGEVPLVTLDEPPVFVIILIFFIGLLLIKRKKSAA